MNIELFQKTYSDFKDSEKIEIECDHPKHDPHKKTITIGKQPAKRNILKNGGKEFICRECFMFYSNPMNSKKNKRQTDEIISVFCPHPEHKGNPSRDMKKKNYYGLLEEPFLQICGSCSQLDKKISEEQKEKIRVALKGIKRSEEFKNKLSEYMKNNSEGIARATKNLLENHFTQGMLGKKHKDETKQKISQSNSGKTFTEEHCKNISEGRKKMLAETGGFSQEHRENISKATIRQYKNGFDPKLHHLNGWHDSPKAGNVFYRSSYEKKAFLKLDQDEKVKTYFVEKINTEYFNTNKKINSTYLIDLLVEYTDSSKKLIEVKPEKFLEDEIVLLKIEAGKRKAQELGIEFEVWTEMNLFGHVFNKNNIELFIDKVKKETTDKKTKKELNLTRAKTHYQKHIATDKVEIYCEFCKETHNPLRLTYDKNIERNGRYICEKEGGHIAGSKAKPHLKKENPYANEGKKQCNKCNQLKLFEEFSPDKSRRDGYCSNCKICRSEKMKAAYEKKNI